jgi:hypothetical protein
MELEMMNLIAQMRDQLCNRDDVIAAAIEAMNKAVEKLPYSDAIKSFPALAVLENVAPTWIEPLAQSLENKGELNINAPIEIRSIHSALALWQPNNRDQWITIIIYGLLVERGEINHSPDDFKTTLMICSN